MANALPDSVPFASFRDLSSGDQWRYLRLATVRRIRRLWEVRNGIADGAHPYVCAAVARGYIREELARLREFRANLHREETDNE